MHKNDNVVQLCLKVVPENYLSVSNQDYLLKTRVNRFNRFNCSIVDSLLILNLTSSHNEYMIQIALTFKFHSTRYQLH